MNKELINLIKTKYDSEENYKYVSFNSKYEFDCINSDKYVAFHKEWILNIIYGKPKLDINENGQPIEIERNEINKIKILIYSKGKKTKQKIKGLDNIIKFIDDLDEENNADNILLKNDSFLWIFDVENSSFLISNDDSCEVMNSLKTEFINLAQEKLKEKIQFNKQDKDAAIRKKEIAKKSKAERKIAINYGIYSMIDEHAQENFIFSNICSLAGGYFAGQLITLAFTPEAYEYPLSLQLFGELSELLDVSNKKETNDVLFLSTSKGIRHIKDIYSKTKNILHKYENNILSNAWNEETIFKIVEKYKPKIIFIDNFQQLDGSEPKKVEFLSKLTREFNVCVFLLYEINNISAKTKPDIKLLNSKEKLVDKSDKIFMFWLLKSNWDNSYYPVEKCDFISVNIVKNRHGKLANEYLYVLDKYDEFSIGAPTDYDRHSDNFIYTIKCNEEDDLDTKQDYLSKFKDELEEAIDDIKSSIQQATKKAEDDKPFMVLKNGIII